MSDFDWTDLDVRLLQLLVAVSEAGSVTGAAQRLGVTQSAVSHLLDKLRAIIGDPLFVRSGRGIVATARAEALAPQARALLAAIERFALAETFEPGRWRTTFAIAANDLQRDVLLPSLLAHLRRVAPGVGLRIIPSGVPTLEMLRDGDCELVISPRPPDGADILQKRLFEDSYRVFYDPAVRSAPPDRDAWIAAEHVTVLYEGRRALDLDQWFARQGVSRHFRVTVPGFSGLPSFLRGTDMLATVPGLLRAHLMRDFACAPVPLPCLPLPMYMVWHRRHQDDPAHRWVRHALEGCVPEALRTGGGTAVDSGAGSSPSGA